MRFYSISAVAMLAFLSFLLPRLEVLEATVVDIDGNPGENAVVIVRTMNKLKLFGSDRERDFSYFRAKTGADGKARVRFCCLNGEFSWWAEARGYYDDNSKLLCFAGNRLYAARA